MLLGGFGFLSRLHGLSIDALVEVEVVLADGTIAIVNEKEKPGMMIRALKHNWRLIKCRFVLGDQRGRNCVWNRDKICCKGISSPGRICGKSCLVSMTPARRADIHKNVIFQQLPTDYRSISFQTHPRLFERSTT